uniref:Secreted protein n=1 Tax=Phakopsora pachyrhizi TaxID=170000 RepID=A0A0S1MJW5_PHAPC
MPVFKSLGLYTCTELWRPHQRATHLFHVFSLCPGCSLHVICLSLINLLAHFFFVLNSLL